MRSPSRAPADPVDLAQWVAQLEACLRGTGIALLEVQAPGVSLRLRRVPGEPSPSAASPVRPPAAAEAPEAAKTAQASPAPAAEAMCQVRAGSVGWLRLSHPLRTQALVQPGQQVRRGQALALLQIGAVLLPVSAPCAGRVARWLAQDGVRVGYGEPLLEIETDTDMEASDAD